MEGKLFKKMYDQKTERVECLFGYFKAYFSTYFCISSVKGIHQRMLVYSPNLVN